MRRGRSRRSNQHWLWNGRFWVQAWTLWLTSCSSPQKSEEHVVKGNRDNATSSLRSGQSATPMPKLYPSTNKTMNPPSLPNENAQPTHPKPPQSLGDDSGMRMLLPVGRSGWAIAAGYLGLLGFVIFPAPLALIVSIIAILDIQKSKKTAKPKYGMGRAIFGLIVGIAGSVILLLISLR